MTRPTAAGPWARDTDLVFLADAKNRVERSILAEWIKSTDPRGSSAAPVNVVQVNLERGQPQDAAALSGVLNLSDETLLVPLRVAWLPERDPQSSAPRLRDLVIGDPRHPKTQVAMFQRRRPDSHQCLAGAPATVEDLRTRHEAITAGVEEDTAQVEEFPVFVLRQAGLALDIAERTLRGRRYKVPRFVTGGIETSRGYTRAVDKLATELEQPAAEVREEGRGYLDEMVASPSTFFIDWMGTLTRWITSLGYSKVVTDPEGVERARAAVRDQPTALLWTHKSHMDGIALLSVLYDNDFPAPHSLGGINMTLGPLGYVGKRSGIIYIRRTFSDNPVYKVALQQYLGFLMSKRFPFSWAFEGTRSRTGKLGPPRYGLLKYVIDAAHATHTEDLHLIPVSINYDLIGETADYAREESGEAKEAESFSWFMGYLKRLRSPMGNIYLDFAEPVVLKGPAPAASRELLAQVAFEVARRANGQVPVTVPSLMCMALLGAQPRALTYTELHNSMADLILWMRARNIRMAADYIHADVQQLQTIADNTFSGGLVERFTEGTETLFAVGEKQTAAAGYYRNTVIHYFVNKAMIEVAWDQVIERTPKSRVKAFWDELRWLRDATKFEFFHTPSEEFEAEIDAELSAYDPAWQEVLAGSREGVRTFLADMRPLVSHVVLQPFLEGYWLAARALAKLPADKEPTEALVSQKAMRLGESALKQQRVSGRPSVSKAMFKSAYQFLNDQGLLATTAPNLEEDRQAMVDRLEKLIATTDRIKVSSNEALFAAVGKR